MVNTFHPNTLTELHQLMNEKELIVMAGGTDLMVRHRSWSNLAPSFDLDVIFVKGISALNYIKESNNELHIGATASLQAILDNKETPAILKDAIAQMASYAIRHTGTLAGNIANASPAGDTLPVLYILNARIVLSSVNGKREVPIEDFITGPGKINKESNEVIEEIIIELPETDFYTFKKVGGRKADAISKISFAGLTVKTSDTHGQTSTEMRMAFGAVGPTIIRNPVIEKAYLDSNIKDSIDSIVAAYEPLIRPIDDQRSTAVYRKQCTINVLKDFLSKI